jgi:NADH-quinone oxidoreductase subunit N
VNLTPTILNALTGQLETDLLLFAPELIVCGAIVVLLLVRLVPAFDRMHLGGIALAATVGALAYTAVQWAQDLPEVTNSFANLLAFDDYTLYLRMLLLGVCAATIVFTTLTGIPDREDSGDFYVLLLGATLGMLLMASANHLLMVFVAVEMASLPSYALAGFLKGRRQSSEAALKYVVYGGGASGVMLYGISLLAGRFGTGFLPDLAQGYAAALQAQAAGGPDAILVLSTLFVLIGLAFKLSLVPFHFWCPDVFEGASAEVAAFLSVASKAAAFALTGRLLLVVATYAPAPELPQRFLAPGLAFFAALTATFGNLAAYPQTNLKRLLAYSTIAHAGYMFMGLSVLTADGTSAVLFYLATYAFMNLGAFAVVAFLRNQTGSEDLSDFRGLLTRAPGMTVLLAIFLLSLLGLPPLAGFAAKFLVFSQVFEAGRAALNGPAPWLGTVYFALLVIGGLNTVFSAVYYLRVLKVMILDKSAEETEGREAARLRVPAGAAAFTGLLAAGVVVLGVAWNPLITASDKGVAKFTPWKRTAAPAIASAPLEGGRR